MKRASLNIKQLMLTGIFALGLSACGANMDDLDQYISEVKNRPGGRIDPLAGDYARTRFSPTLQMPRACARRSAPTRHRPQAE